MTSLRDSLSLKARSVKAAKPLAPESGGEGGTPKGGNGLKSSIALKNRGIVPSPGVEKTNGAS